MRLLLAVLLVSGLSSSVRKPSFNAPLTQEIYIWQRLWTDETTSAVNGLGKLGDGLLPLAAQLTWNGKQGRQVAWPNLNWELLKHCGKRITLCIRIDPISTAKLQQTNALQAVHETVQTLLSKTRQHGVEPSELQLDFDAADSQLPIYTKWIREVKTAVGHLMKVTFTALPTWLNSPQFVSLARAGDGYVLQVHACEKPALYNHDLCNPASATAWVNQAARAAPGIPFKVALPTYAYDLGFDASGKYIGAQAEGEERSWPRGSVIHSLRADGPELAGLMTVWEASRPAELGGLVWFRLPMASDNRNWKLVTLQHLLERKQPSPKWEAEAVAADQNQLYDLQLLNKGDASGQLPKRIQLSWQNGTCEACEALPGYSAHQSERSAEFARNSDELVLPGESRAIGWLRFSSPTSVSTSLEN